MYNVSPVVINFRFQGDRAYFGFGIRDNAVKICGKIFLISQGRAAQVGKLQSRFALVPGIFYGYRILIDIAVIEGHGANNGAAAQIQYLGSISHQG